MFKRKKILAISSLLVIAVSFSSYASSELTYHQTNQQIDETLKLNELEQLNELNLKLIKQHQKLNFRELERALDDANLSDNVKCYYLDLYRSLSDSSGQREKFEMYIWKHFDSAKLSDIVRSYLISCLSLEKCVDISKLEKYANSDNKDLRLRTLCTIANLNSAQSFSILQGHLEQSKDKEEFLYIARFLSLIDESRNLDSIQFNNFITKNNLNESELTSILYTISEYKNPKFLKMINENAIKLTEHKKNFILDNSTIMIEEAIKSEAFNKDALNSIRIAPFKKYEKLLNTDDMRKLNELNVQFSLEDLTGGNNE